MEMEYMYMGCVAGTRLFSFFALFTIVGVLTRSAIQGSVLCEGTFKHPLQDAVTAFEVYGCNIGHIYVFQIYGLGTHLAVLLAVGVYHAFFLNGFTANPITHVLQYLMNCCPPDVTITKMFALVLGGLVGQVTAIFLWPLLMTEFDKETLTQMHCVAASASLPAIVCLGVEFFGMVVICILVINIASSRVDAFEPPMKFLTTCLFSGTGLCVSNVYLNPVVASSRLIGCYDKNVFHHLVIYWIAPIGGAAVAVLQAEVTSCNSDLACLPFCECRASRLKSGKAAHQSGKACAGLKSDVKPDRPRLRTTFRQVSRPSTLLLNNEMPTIYVSSTDDDEDGDENSDDEVLYSCAKKYSNVGRVNGLDGGKQDNTSTRYRRCTEQSFDDACSSGVSEPSGNVTSRKTNGGLRNCAPISSAGQIRQINQSSLCGNMRTVRDCMTVAYSCCCYMKSRPADMTNNISSASCTSKDTNNAQLVCTSENYPKPLSCLMAAQPKCNYPGNQSSTVRGASDNVRSSPEADNRTNDIVKTTAPPIRKRSLRFKLPIRDDSQNKETDDDELSSNPSVYSIKKIAPPPEFDEKPPQDEYELQSPQNYSSQSLMGEPSQDEYVVQSSQKYSSQSLMGGPSQNEYVLQSPQNYSSLSSKVEPSKDKCMPQSPEKYSTRSCMPVVVPSQDVCVPQSPEKYSTLSCMVVPSQVECVPKSSLKHSSPRCMVEPSQSACMSQTHQKCSISSSVVGPSQDSSMSQSPQPCGSCSSKVDPSQDSSMSQSPQPCGSCSSKVEPSQDTAMSQSPQTCGSCSSKVDPSQDSSMSQSPQPCGSCSSKVEPSQDTSMSQSPQTCGSFSSKVEPSQDASMSQSPQTCGSCSSKVEPSQDASMSQSPQPCGSCSSKVEPSPDAGVPQSPQICPYLTSKAETSQDAGVPQLPQKCSPCNSNVGPSQDERTPLPLKKPSTQSCMFEPSQDKCVPKSPKKYSSCSSKMGLSQDAGVPKSHPKCSSRSYKMGLSQDAGMPKSHPKCSSRSSKIEPSQDAGVPQAQQKYSSCSSKVGPWQAEYTPLPPKKPSAQTQIPKKSSHHVSKSHPNSHPKPSHQSPTDTNRLPSHIHRHKSPHKDKHAKPSQKSPSGADPRPSNSRPHKCTPQCGCHKTLHLGPSNACHTPSPNNPCKLSPSGAKDRSPSSQRSRDASTRRASPTRSKTTPSSQKHFLS